MFRHQSVLHIGCYFFIVLIWLLVCASAQVAERVAAERAETVGNGNSCGYQIRLQRWGSHLKHMLKDKWYLVLVWDNSQQVLLLYKPKWVLLMSVMRCASVFKFHYEKSRSSLDITSNTHLQTISNKNIFQQDLEKSLPRHWWLMWSYSCNIVTILALFHSPEEENYET